MLLNSHYGAPTALVSNALAPWHQRLALQAMAPWLFHIGLGPTRLLAIEWAALTLLGVDETTPLMAPLHLNFAHPDIDTHALTAIR